MNVLIINRKNTNNLGDRAISMSMKKLFETYADVYTEDFCSVKESSSIKSNTAKTTPNIHPVKKAIAGNPFIRIRSWKKNNKGLFDILDKREYDYIIIGGGELIQSNFTFPLALYEWVKRAKKMQSNAKIVLFSVGCTNNFDRFQHILVKKALRNVGAIYLRDTASVENMYNQFKREAKEIPDCVFANSFDFACAKKYIFYSLTTSERLKKHGNVQNNENDYFEDCYKYLDENFTGRKEDIRLFYTTKEDYGVCLKFLEYVYKKYSQKIETADIESLEDLISELATAETVISPRMHGCILGKLVGAKVVPILISEKMKSYNKKYENESFKQEQAKELLDGAVKEVLKK